MRRQLWRCAEVNTWAKVIYCDRIDRIVIDWRPMLMSILHAAPQHTPSVQCASVSETWRKKGGKRFGLFFLSIPSFLSVLASFAFGRPLRIVVRTHGHRFVVMRLCRCLRRTHNSYLHATKCLACVINAKISTCKLFVCCFFFSCRALWSGFFGCSKIYCFELSLRFTSFRPIPSSIIGQKRAHSQWIGSIEIDSRSN